jgi:nucleoside-triphosphatase|uniref:NTPase n=1 Tax=candidate division WOR-3 bacterium TaxID=2052148 RepID=A0A7C3YT60_UNCW3
MKKIFLRGRPGIGKTTLIKRIAEELKRRKKKVFGFYTEEMREKGERVGFKVKGLNGGEEIMAYIHFSTPYRVSKYRVDRDRFEKIALSELAKGKEEGGLVIIDEIGKMELFSERFKELVWELMESESPVIATIPIAPLPFLQRLLEDFKIEIIEIDLTNRDRLAKEWERFLGIDG